MEEFESDFLGSDVDGSIFRFLFGFIGRFYILRVGVDR